MNLFANKPGLPFLLYIPILLTISLLLPLTVSCSQITATTPENVTVVWAKTLAGYYFDQSNGLALDHLGNIYIVGDSYGTIEGNTAVGAGDILVAKFNSTGNVLWVRFMGTSFIEDGNAIAVDSSGNVYITGKTYTTGSLEGQISSGSGDVVIAKYDTDGNLGWVRLLGSSDGEEGHSIVFDPSGYLYIAGDTCGTLDGNSPLESEDIFLAKYDINGNKIWVKLLGSTRYARSPDIALNAEGNILMTGYTQGNVGSQTNTGEEDIILAKFDKDGNQKWVKLLGTYTRDIANAIALDASQNIYITGYSYGNLGGITNEGWADTFVMKCDSSGNVRWISGLGSTESDIPSDLAVDSDGSIYVSGGTDKLQDDNNNTNSGIFLLKYNENGDREWIKLFGTTSYDYGTGIAVDASSYLYITGNTRGNLQGNTNAGWDDIFLMKLKPQDTPTNN